MQLCHLHPFLAVINQPYLVINEPICELTPHQSTPWQQSGSYLGIEPANDWERKHQTFVHFLETVAETGGFAVLVALLCRITNTYYKCP